MKGRGRKRAKNRKWGHLTDAERIEKFKRLIEDPDYLSSSINELAGNLANECIKAEEERETGDGRVR